jgi:hypothetical protein
MADKWWKYRIPETVPHPDSAAGRNFDWSSLGLPHPDTPAGRNFDWASVGVPHPYSSDGRILQWRSTLSAEHWKREELAQEMREVETLLSEQSDNFRDALPTTSLRSTYDLQLGLIGGTPSSGRSLAGMVSDLSLLLRKLHVALDWFDQSSRSPKDRSDLLVAIDKLRFLTAPGPAKEKKQLLEGIKALSENVYEAARKDIDEDLRAAKRAGEYDNLIEKWKRRMFERPAYALSTRAGLSVVPEVLQPAIQRTPPGSRSKTAWVEIQVLDMEENPLAGIRYEILLPGGRKVTGTTDDSGLARYDDIDSGQCEIAFPDLDQDLWRRL